MPGFGHADKPFAGRYTTAGGAQFINDMLAHLGIARVHFVLHDFGGFWALQWAAEHTSRVASVTLIDTGVLTGYIGHPFGAIWDTPVVGEVDIGASSRAGFDLLFQAQNPRPLPSWFVDRMYDDFDRGTRCAVLSYYRDFGLPESRWEAQQAIFSKLGLPALVIWGADDPYEPSSQADNQKKSFPAAEVHVLPNTGHFPFIDEPEITRSLTVSFLRRVVTPQAAPVQRASPQLSSSRHKRRRAQHRVRRKPHNSGHGRQRANRQPRARSSSGDTVS
jgi:pimeloyl-ACP methyl ester carboxylesterase